MTTKEIGDFGEKAAEDYLVEMDYLILERNYRLKFGEIDIIAARDGGLVFVEVKTRKPQKARTGEKSRNGLCRCGKYRYAI